MSGLAWRAGSIVVGLWCSATLLAMSAQAADMYTKAPPAPAGCTQAVDGLNGKVSAEGGTFNDKDLYGGQGSFSAPLGCQFGFQIDGGAGSFNESTIYSIGGHLFWRDPQLGLLGVYGSYARWDQFTGLNANHIGPEGAWYFGRFTIEGVAGVEFGNSTTATVGAGAGSNIVTYDVTTRFFDQINFAYYLTDNLKAYLGHRFIGGKNALAIGGEWGVPIGHGAMGAMFVEGRVGDDNTSGIWGGIRFYFGQKDKTLIQRHREDDPIDWNTTNVPNPGTSTPTPTTVCCPTAGSIPLVAGMQLAENIVVGVSRCCQNFTALDAGPGTQLAANIMSDAYDVATACCRPPV